MEHVLSSVIDSATYDILKYILVSLVATSAATYLIEKLRNAHKLKETVTVAVCCFAIISAAFYMLSPRTQGPQLAGSIPMLLSGPFDGGRSTMAVITINVLNAGSMQSIVKNWNVEVLIDDQKYQGQLMVPPPAEFTFKNELSRPGEANAITYHGSDNILDKASISPIQSGGMVSGILFVVFPSLNPNSFKAGAQFTVKYEDALSKSYVSIIRVNANIPTFTGSPGIKTELACPAPPQSFTPLPPQSN